MQKESAEVFMYIMLGPFNGNIMKNTVVAYSIYTKGIRMVQEALKQIWSHTHTAGQTHQIVNCRGQMLLNNLAMLSVEAY